MEHIQWAQEPQSFCGDPVHTATTFKAVRFEHTTPDGRQFLSQAKFWSTLKFRIRRPGMDFYSMYPDREGTSHNPSNPDLWLLDYYLDGMATLSRRRGPFSSLKEAMDHATTMAQGWGYAHAPNPEEQASPLFVGQQIPVNRTTPRRS